MNIRTNIFCFGLMLVCMAAFLFAPPVPADQQKTVLLIAGPDSHGHGEHEHRAGCHLLAKCLNENMPEMKAIVSEGWPKDEILLEQADSIVIYCDGGEGHLILPHLEPIDRLMEKGVGLMCIHYAVEVPKGVPADYFTDWIGGYYEKGWSTNPRWTAEADLNRDHPITRGVSEFELHDEWYFNMRWRNNDAESVTPVFQATPDDEARSRYDGRIEDPSHLMEASGREETLMWARERDDGGRGVGFTGAHYHQLWKDDDFRKLVLNAIVWSAGAEVPKDGVESSTPSDAEMAMHLSKP